ncbi:MAG: LysM peptidoglycan-binding domain-containing protein [Planctomycetota bacterium]|jgi:LysM repeat protein
MHSRNSWSAVLVFIVVLALAALACGEIDSTPRPASVPQYTEDPETEPTVTPVVHVVVAGETLGTIAKRYGTTVELLVDLNDIDNPDLIEVGQKILVSLPDGWVPPTATRRPTFTPRPPTRPPAATKPPPTPPAQRSCCKICRKGKACGDSCISRDKTCHQPPGCACNAY